MFSLFKKKDLPQAKDNTKDKSQGPSQAQAPVAVPWIQRLAQGLKKTSSNLSQVFGGAQIDEALFEHLEEALLMSDAGVKATAYLLKDLQVQVKKKGLTEPKDVKALLRESMCHLLKPLEAKMDLSKENHLHWQAPAPPERLGGERAFGSGGHLPCCCQGTIAKLGDSK